MECSSYSSVYVCVCLFNIPRFNLEENIMVNKWRKFSAPSSDRIKADIYRLFFSHIHSQHVLPAKMILPRRLQDSRQIHDAAEGTFFFIFSWLNYNVVSTRFVAHLWDKNIRGGKRNLSRMKRDTEGEKSIKKNKYNFCKGIIKIRKKRITLTIDYRFNTSQD